MSEVELTISSKPDEPGSFRLVATLGIAGLLSGLILVFAFQITAPIIAKNKVMELRRGVFKVVPNSSKLEALTFVDGELVPLGDRKVTKDEVIYAAYGDDEEFLGYAVVASGNGFQDTIRLLYGYDPVKRAVIGLHILESRETPGLGDKIYKDPDFVGQFEFVLVDPTVELVKGGRTADNQVDAITGATISSTAVVKTINTAHAKWDARTKGTQPRFTQSDTAGGEE